MLDLTGMKRDIKTGPKTPRKGQSQTETSRGGLTDGADNQDNKQDADSKWNVIIAVDPVTVSLTATAVLGLAWANAVSGNVS